MKTRTGLIALLAMSIPAFGCETATGPSEAIETDNPLHPDLAEDGKILIDASRDGGVWWFPQGGTFLPDDDHQGKALADYLRSQGYEVEELARGTLITDDLLSAYRYVIRASEWGSYRASELDAYRRFVDRETTLVLLGEHMSTDPKDELAESLGVTFVGDRSGILTRYAEHPITEGVSARWFYGNGAVATDYENDFDIIAWVDDDLPVMGVSTSYAAKVFFSGDTGLVLDIPQPLVDNLLRWGFDLQ